MDSPLISICIPFYPMKDHEFFMSRCLESIKKQTYTNYEVVINEHGSPTENTNQATKKAKGDIVKILFMDDYFTSETSLQEIVNAFKDDTIWLITGCDNNLVPVYTGDIHLGNNKLGSPSVLAFRKGTNVDFDESLWWMFDCDFYKKMYIKWGLPKILIGNNVTIGVGPHQLTENLLDETKKAEIMILRQRYV